MEQEEIIKQQIKEKQHMRIAGIVLAFDIFIALLIIVEIVLIIVKKFA